jgi:thioredoxin 1
MKLVSDFDFDEILKNELPVVVEFYSPHCAHCQGLKHTLQKVEDELSDKAIIAAVDITESPATTARFDILSVPTLLFFKDRQMKEKLLGYTHELIIKETIKKLK